MSDAVIDLSMGRKQNNVQISMIEFPCPACNQDVKGDRGYYVQHDVTVISPYGVPEQRICPASNNKIKAELRTLKMHGECENCQTQMDLELTEEYPGGLKQEGGWLETTCTVCNGETVSVCDHCGGHLRHNEVNGLQPDVLEGCLVKEGEDIPEWFHATNGLAECPNQVLAEETEECTICHQQIAEANKSDLCPMRSNNGNHEFDEDDEELPDEFFDAAPKELLKATPMQGSIHSNPKHMVIVRDNFTITITEDDAPRQDPEV